MSKEQDIKLSKGDKVSVKTPGGGGYGCVLREDPKLVLKDLVEQKCNRKQAENLWCNHL